MGRVSHRRVFSCARMRAPCLPTASLRPVCSGCQWVLTSVCTRFAPAVSSTSFSSALACSRRPPSNTMAPSADAKVTTLAPAPVIRARPWPRPWAARRGLASRASTLAGPASSAPAEARVAVWMKPRRDRAFMVRFLVKAAPPQEGATGQSDLGEPARAVAQLLPRYAGALQQCQQQVGVRRVLLVLQVLAPLVAALALCEYGIGQRVVVVQVAVRHVA